MVKATTTTTVRVKMRERMAVRRMMKVMSQKTAARINMM
jgi:hypothetical protein